MGPHSAGCAAGQCADPPLGHEVFGKLIRCTGLFGVFSVRSLFSRCLNIVRQQSAFLDNAVNVLKQMINSKYVPQSMACCFNNEGNHLWSVGTEKY